MDVHARSGVGTGGGIEISAGIARIGLGVAEQVPIGVAIGLPSRACHVLRVGVGIAVLGPLVGMVQVEVVTELVHEGPVRRVCGTAMAHHHPVARGRVEREVGIAGRDESGAGRDVVHEVDVHRIGGRGEKACQRGFTVVVRRGGIKVVVVRVVRGVRCTLPEELDAGVQEVVVQEAQADVELLLRDASAPITLPDDVRLQRNTGDASPPQGVHIDARDHALGVGILGRGGRGGSAILRVERVPKEGQAGQ